MEKLNELSRVPIQLKQEVDIKKSGKEEIFLDDIVEYILYGNKFYKYIIETTIEEIKRFLEDKVKCKFKIKVFVVSDLEIQEWRELIFSIKIKDKEIENLFDIWDEIGLLVKNKIMEIKKISTNKKIIDQIYEKISIEFEN